MTTSNTSWTQVQNPGGCVGMAAGFSSSPSVVEDFGMAKGLLSEPRAVPFYLFSLVDRGFLPG